MLPLRARTISLGWTAVLMIVVGTGCSSCTDRSRPAGSPRAPASQRVPPAASETPTRQRVREPAVAGSWYPDDPRQLTALLNRHLAQAKGPARLEGKVIALISPHAGYAFSGNAAAAGYRLLAKQDIRRVVLLAVAHRVPFSGASIADVTHYRTPLGLIPVDRAAVARLRESELVKTVAAAHLQEHSLEMQLPLLQRVVGKFQLVPLLLGRMVAPGHAQLAKALADVVDQHTLVVASSDFTHRGPNYSYELPPGKGSIKERLQRLDQGSIDRILAGDADGLLAYQNKTGSTICGLAPVVTLLKLLALQKPRPTPHLVSHYTSGDVTGNWTNTVTYVDVAFTGRWPAPQPRLTSAGAQKVFPLSGADKRTLVGLARRSLQAAVRKGEYDPGVLQLDRMPASLRRKAGAFVTLTCKLGAGGVCVGRGHDLRGCIGTIAPVSPVASTVARRAASAALEDRRFPNPVVPDELKLIAVEVSVLTPPRRVAGPGDIVLGRHGIILRKGFASATYLPQVAPQQKWTLEQTLSHLSRKAGLGPDGWRDGAQLSVYEAIVFSEASPNEGSAP